MFPTLKLTLENSLGAIVEQVFVDETVIYEKRHAGPFTVEEAFLLTSYLTRTWVDENSELHPPHNTENSLN
jgi:hypothetical protein